MSNLLSRQLRFIASAVSSLFFLFLLFACEGVGGGSSSGDSNANAPTSLTGYTYLFSRTSDSGTEKELYKYGSDNLERYGENDQSPDTLSYEYNADGSTGTVTATFNNQTVIITMSFTSSSAGTFSITGISDPYDGVFTFVDSANLPVDFPDNFREFL